MDSQHSQTTDPKTQEIITRMNRRDHRTEQIIRRILYILEHLIAVLSILALVAALCIEIYQMITTSGYFDDISNYLHNILTIVVGLEFVRMLIDTTPANILEVLTVAITRHVILSHDNPWSNMACIACIAGLFAIRRFLIPRNELKEEMVGTE